MNRAVITGMGMICSLGHTRHEICRAVLTNTCGIQPITSLNLETLSTKVGGEISLDHYSFPPEVSPDKASQLAYIAFKQALLDSGLDLTTIPPKDIALSYGTCNGNVRTLESYYKDKKTNPETYKTIIKNYFNGIDFISHLYPILGEKAIFVTACAASNQAIGYAKDLIARGDATIVIVGGSDALAESTFAGFHALQALAATPCSPFSSHVGISLGEGAGFIILEESTHAMRRKAKIYGEVLGYGFSADAYHATTPDPTGRGAKQSMEHALADAKLQPNDLPVICAHGTGTWANDTAETQALHQVFQDHSRQLAVTSTKSLYGHTLGASGITQSILMVDCMHLNIIPPIINAPEQREGCDLDYVFDVPRIHVYDKFMSNSFAFGGNNVSLILGKFHKTHPQTAITGYAITTPHITDITTLKKECLTQLHTPTITPHPVSKFKLTNPHFRKFGKTPLSSKLAIQCVEDCLSHANFTPKENNRTALLMGITSGINQTFETFYTGVLNNGVALGSALDFPHIVMNAISGQVAIAHKLTGCNTVIAGHSSAFSQLKYGTALLASGRQDHILVSTSDTQAACLLLESAKTATKSNRHIYGYIDGIASTSFAIGKSPLTSYHTCIHQTLTKSNTSDHTIGLHLGCGLATKYKKDMPFLNVQDILGITESSITLVSLILAIECLHDTSFSNHICGRSVDTILVTSIAETGTCHSLIVKKYKRRDT